jgi:hypothetical protein
LAQGTAHALGGAAIESATMFRRLQDGAWPEDGGSPGCPSRVGCTQTLARIPPGSPESFSEFAASKGWQAEHHDAAVSVYGMIRDQGPDAVMSLPPTPKEDAATIARASELLRTNPDAY